MLAYLDANVLLRHLLNDHADHSPRASAYFGQVEQGLRRARLVDVVLFEVAFTLERSYRQTKQQVRDLLLPLLSLPGIVFTNKDSLALIFDTYVGSNVSFADAYIAAHMLRAGESEIISFDHDFDRIPGIQRLEPGAA